jgi:hypothetical protein
MKTIFILIALILNIFLISPLESQDLFTPTETAPGWNWAFTMGGSGGAAGTGIIYDASDNYYVTGYFNGTATFGSTVLTSTGLWDMFYAKYNSSGTMLWVKKISALSFQVIQGMEIGLDSADNVYISGNFSGAVTIGTTILTSPGGKNVFLARFDNGGNAIWAVQYGYSPDEVLGCSTVDANGNIYLTATDATSNLVCDLVKFNNSGQVQWQKVVSAPLTDIVCNPSGFCITGYIWFPTTFGSTVLTSGSYPSFFVSKADINGNFQWARNGTSNYGESRGFSVTTDNAENVYVSGSFYDTIHFTPANYLVSCNAEYSAFVVKYTPAGTYAMSGLVPENNFYDYTPQAALDAGGNIFVFGNCDGDFSFGTSQVSGPGSYIAKFDPAGNAQWAKNEDYSSSKSSFSAADKLIQAGSKSYDAFVKQSNNAADPLWTASIPTDGGLADSWYSGDLDNDGYSYVQGHLEGKGDFLGYPLEGNGIFLAKISGDRHLRWITSFVTGSASQNADPSGVAHDNAGNFYAWGTFSDSLTIDGHVLVNPLSSGSAGYIVKFNKECFYQWSGTFSATMGITGVGGITTDNAGNVLITGYYYDSLFIGSQTFKSNGGPDIFIAKYSPDGTLLLTKSIGGNGSDYGRGISTDGQNNFYITGGFSLTVNFGTTTLTAQGGYDAFVAKYDQGGNEQWAVKAGGPSRERGHSIGTDSNGNTYISGAFYGNQMTFGSITITSPYTMNLFVAKYSPSGTPLWAKAIQSQTFSWPAYQLGLDNAGNCYIGGDYYDSLIFESGLHLTGGANNHFLAKFTSAGNLAWTKNIVGANGISSLFGIRVFAENSVVVSGRIYNEALAFDANTVSSANSNAYLALLGSDLPMGIKPVQKELNTLNVFPNPASDRFFLQFNEPPANPFVCDLTDATGRVVFSDTFRGLKQVRIDLPVLAPGVYVLSVKTGNQRYYDKVVIH